MQVPTATCILAGPELAVVLANERYEALTGKSNLVGRTVREVFPELEGQGFFELLDRVMVTCEPHVGHEVPIQIDRHGTGATATGYVTFVYHPTRDSSGQVTGIFVQAIDVTERVDARHRLDAVLEQLPVGVIVAEAPNGRVILANGRVGEILGYDPLQTDSIGDYAGYTALHQDGTRYSASEYPLVRAITSGEVVANEELYFERGDGSRRWMAISAAPIRNQEGRIDAGVVIFTDITDRKERLLEEREAREGAERAVQRQTLLAAATGILSQSLEIDELLAEIARIVVPNLADVYFVDLVEGGQLRRAGWSARGDVDGSFDALARFVPGPDHPQHPIRQVLTTRAPVLVPVVDAAWIESVSTNSGHLQFLRSIDLRSLMSVPLTARGAVNGVLSLTRLGDDSVGYGEDDLALAVDLAFRIAHAIDNARLYRLEQLARAATERAADRTERLLRVSAALASAVTREEVAETVLRAGIAAVGAAAGALGVLVDNNTRLERLAMIGYPTEISEATLHVPLDDLGPIATTARTGEAIWLETNDALFSQYPQLDSIPARRAFGAAVSIPIDVAGRVIGVMSYRYREERPFDAGDRDLMRAIARQCGIALERARLYESEHLARAEAEAAVRARDEFLSIASHELKTPVAALKASAQLLQRRLERGSLDPDYLARTLEIFDETSDRLTRLTSDLLDVSRLRTGNLTLVRRPVDPRALVENVLRQLGDQLGQHHQVIVRAEEQPLVVPADAVRIEQVLANLLENAAKYSPAGGEIVVEVRAHRDGVEISVHDPGIGLPSGATETIFEPFGRAPNAAVSGIPGMGLGLHICRTIVEQHGGRIQAESSGEGQGSTFSIWLPSS